MHFRLYKKERSTAKIFSVKILFCESEFFCKELFKYSFCFESESAKKLYEECKEKFEKWLKESELEDSIKNSIKIAFFDKNTITAIIEIPEHELQD